VSADLLQLHLDGLVMSLVHIYCLQHLVNPETSVTDIATWQPSQTEFSNFIGVPQIKDGRMGCVVTYVRLTCCGVLL
jgi:hypothetical protein